jgi:hypothetical protein
VIVTAVYFEIQFASIARICALHVVSATVTLKLMRWSILTVFVDLAFLYLLLNFSLLRW